MRIRKILMLLIFTLSILIVNLQHSNQKPPLFDKNSTNNIVILVDHIEGIHEELVVKEPTNLSDTTVIYDNYRDMIPILSVIIVLLTKVFKSEIQSFRTFKIKGLYGILLRDRKRLLRN